MGKDRALLLFGEQIYLIKYLAIEFNKKRQHEYVEFTSHLVTLLDVSVSCINHILARVIG